MAKNNFNFQAKLGLETKDFKRGVRETKSLLTSLSSDFRGFAASLAAGLSIGSIFDKMKDSALELSTAMNTLKNVSSLNKDIFSSFGGNLEYVQGLANKYGQNILALTDSYAKFTAASYGTGLSLEKQKTIFESLTRAAAYYHLSADQTRDMMNAVNQMMSKGKVAAEELRRQLGNTLPGAFNLMAMAIGVSTAELDSMMKKGEVIASEVLPKFADQLYRVTAGGNFDSLQASLNKFDNAWLTFVKNSGFENFYKGIVDSGTWALNKVAENTNAISHLLIGALGAGFAQMVKVQSQKAYENLNVELGNMERRLKLFQGSISHMTLRNGEHFATPVQAQGGGTYFQPTSPILSQKEIDKIKEMNIMLLKANNIKKQLGQTPILSDMDVKRIQVINRELTGMGASMKGVNTTWAGFKVLAGNVWKTIKGIGKSLLAFGAVTAIFTAISWAVGKVLEKINEVKERAKELAEIGDTYNNTIQEGKEYIAQQVRQSNEYLRIIKNTNISLHTRKKTLEKLSELTENIEIKDLNVENIKEGTKEYEKLTRAVSNWAKSMEKAHIIDIYTREAARAQVEIDNLYDRLEELSGEPLTKSVFGITGSTQSSFGAMPAFGRKIVDTEAGKEVKQIHAKIKEYQKNIADARKQVSNYNSQLDELLEEFYNDGPDNGNGNGGSEKGIAEIFEAYNKKKRELANQLKEGAITQQKYEEEFDRLIQQTWADAAATGGLFIADILKKQDSGKTLSIMEKWYLELAKNARESIMNALFEESDELFKKLSEQTEKDLEDALTQPLEKVQKEMEKKIKEWHKYINMYNDYVLNPETRDPLFDYNKSKSDILGEELQIAENNVDRIKDILNHLYDLQEAGENVTNELSLWSKELEKVQANASNIYDAMNIAKLREDIKKLSEDLGFGVYDSIINVVGGIDSIVNSFQRMEETLKDFDASGWEKFISVFEAFIEVANFGIGLYETINSLMEISNKLKLAEAAEQSLINKGKAEEAQVALTTSIAKGIEAQMIQNTVAARTAELAAMTAQIQAAKELAVAQAVAASASVPFPGNIAAMGASAAAAIAAMSLPKFESGGIVSGNSTHGDKNLVRANSGELILNKSQQGTLFNAIKSGNLGGGGGEWRVRGTDLIKVINNTQNKLRG